LTRVVSALLGLLGLVLMAHPFMALNGLAVEGPVRAGIGIVAGVGIGLVSSLLGLAGGELIIPTLVLQHGFDIELAGSLSLAISIPTVILGLIRYQRRGQLERLASLRPLLLWMAAGSTLGALVGALLLPWVSSLYLHLLLGAVLLASAMRLARH